MSARALLWVPLPPPVAGPEIASQLLADACREELPDLLVENATLRTNNMNKGRLDAAGVAAFAKAYVRFISKLRQADLVYMVAAANTVGCMRDAVLIATAKAMRRHVVLHMHGGRYGEHYASSGPMMRWLLRRAWGSVTTAIVQTPRLRSALKESAPHVQVAVLPNGLPTGEFEAKRTYRQSGCRVLFVGHLTYSKGFFDLMHAMDAVRDAGVDVTLACAGELPAPDRNFAEFLPIEKRADYLRDRHEICDQIRAFVKREHVEYAGVVTGQVKVELFRSADLLVLPSYTEGFSLAILEAMFYGLPVIASSAGGTPDIVQHDVNGLIVPAGDRERLADAIRRLALDPALRERMGRRNAAEARARYDIAHVAKQLVNILVDAGTRASS